MQHQHTVCAFGFFDKVGGPQHGAAAFAHIRLDGLQQVAPRLGVEPHSGLVHQQHRGAMQQRAHQFNLAPVAAREFTHQAIQVVEQAASAAVGLDALARQRLGQAVQSRVETQVVGHAQVQVERHLLEDHTDVAQRPGGV